MSGQTHTWSESNAYVKDAITNAKDEVITSIKSKCKFLVDSPDANGGNTNSGEVAKKLFSVEHRDSICSLINKSADREAFFVLLGYFNQLLSITQNVDPLKTANP